MRRPARRLGTSALTLAIALAGAAAAPAAGLAAASAQASSHAADHDRPARGDRAVRLLGDRLDDAAALAAEDSPAGVRAALGAGVRQVHGIGTSHPREVLLDAGAVEVHGDLRPLLPLLRA